MKFKKRKKFVREMRIDEKVNMPNFIMNENQKLNIKILYREFFPSQSEPSENIFPIPINYSFFHKFSQYYQLLRKLNNFHLILFHMLVML